jgi:hypothetical protein
MGALARPGRAQARRRSEPRRKAGLFSCARRGKGTALAVPKAFLILSFRAKKIIRFANDLHSRGICLSPAQQRRGRSFSRTAREGLCPDTPLAVPECNLFEFVWNLELQIPRLRVISRHERSRSARDDRLEAINGTAESRALIQTFHFGTAESRALDANPIRGANDPAAVGMTVDGWKFSAEALLHPQDAHGSMTGGTPVAPRRISQGSRTGVSLRLRSGQAQLKVPFDRLRAGSRLRDG